MVRKVSYILFFVSILANTFSCQMMNKSRYKNCNDIIITENIFSLIDTTQIYNIEDLTLKNRNHSYFFRKADIKLGEKQFVYILKDRSYTVFLCSKVYELP